MADYNFSNYNDVQAALDREYIAWKGGDGAGGNIPINRSGFAQTEEGTQAREWWANQNSSSAPSSSSPAPPPPPPSPILPNFRSIPTNFAIKQAPIDAVVFDDTAFPPAMLEDLMYEDIGGIELANMSRSDLIDGQEVSYTPIKNLSSLRRRFNPNNIISSATSSGNNFSKFSIDLISRGINIPYLDSYGNLVIEIDEVHENEIIDVEIASSGTINTVNI
jgi:hypothetical protein